MPYSVLSPGCSGLSNRDGHESRLPRREFKRRRGHAVLGPSELRGSRYLMNLYRKIERLELWSLLVYDTKN